MGDDGKGVFQPPRCVVGIGASAGGLPALQAFFQSVPEDSGHAYVVVQHLSPDFRSLMGDLLLRYTSLPVYQVEDGMLIEANAVYLIPPKMLMTVKDGHLFLRERDKSSFLEFPIDVFLHSLAEEYGHDAIGIILSGTGSDGSESIRSLHSEGGLVLVQSPESSDFDGMPQSAMDTGKVHVTASPEELYRMIEENAGRKPRPVPRPGKGQKAEEKPEESQYQEVFMGLEEFSGTHFGYYKSSTVNRRIQRRMSILEISSVADYVARLKEDPEETKNLYDDLHIGVTSFFRDEAVFQKLREDIVPRIFRSGSGPLRLWVAGCSTGEEAYTLGMILLEIQEKAGTSREITIFATDSFKPSIEKAAKGIYSAAALDGLSEERKERFFVSTNDGRYKVITELRNCIVFAEHNLIMNPPFTRIDLISCRNLLIYLNLDIQDKILGRFHYSLNEGGFLVLGTSEGVSGLNSHYTTYDARLKLFRKREGMVPPPSMKIPLKSPPRKVRTASVDQFSAEENGLHPIHHGLMQAYDKILETYAPCGFLLDHQYQILHYFGHSGRFMQPPSGRVGEGGIYLLRSDLKAVAIMLLHRVRDGQRKVDHIFSTRMGADEMTVKICAMELPTDSIGQPLYHLSIEERSTDEQGDESAESGYAPVLQLEEQLFSMRENLEATVEELQASNEELQVTNEEMMAANEELQSTNEELHSVNEELYTVNAEYELKNEELIALNQDHQSLLESLDIGIVFLDETLRIRRFNRAISKSLHLLPLDVGRPLDHIAYNLDSASSLVSRVEEVYASGEIRESRVKTKDGVQMIEKVYPYRSNLSDISGVVITLSPVAVDS